MREFFTTFITGTIAVAILGLIVVMWTFGPGVLRTSSFPSEWQREHYREVCEPIIVWIDERKVLTGRYPRALPPGHLATIKNLDPLSGYRVFGRGESFELHIGDYVQLHEWMYYYSSTTEKWFADT